MTREYGLCCDDIILHLGLQRGEVERVEEHLEGGQILLLVPL